MRLFKGGAMRDTEDGKLDYAKAMDPRVLRRYVQYLGKHRQQTDGTMRGWDNWKAGIPSEVYLSSLMRHTWDAWETAQDGCASGEAFEDALCAILFNTMGWLREVQRGESAEVAQHLGDRPSTPRQSASAAVNRAGSSNPAYTKWGGWPARPQLLEDDARTIEAPAEGCTSDAGSKVQTDWYARIGRDWNEEM